MKKAFTLIEILIVVILLGILAAVVIPQFVDQADTARTAAAAQTEAVLNSSWQQYCAAQMAAGTDVSAVAPSAATLVTAGYLKEAPDATKFTVTVAGTGAAGTFTVAAVGATAAS